VFVASESDTDSQVSFYIMFQSLPGASLGGSWPPARPAASRHPGTPGNSESQLLPAGTRGWMAKQPTALKKPSSRNTCLFVPWRRWG